MADEAVAAASGRDSKRTARTEEDDEQGDPLERISPRLRLLAAICQHDRITDQASEPAPRAMSRGSNRVRTRNSARRAQTGTHRERATSATTTQRERKERESAHGAHKDRTEAAQ